ncbi:MAG: ATP-binding protein [Chlamydiota bacterium]
MKSPSWSHFLESPADLSELPALMDWVREQLSKLNSSSKSKMRLELVLEEAIVNVIHYAYPGSAGKLRIQCDYFPGGLISFVLEDEGIAFDPLSIQEPQTDMSLENRKEGGMGVFLIRKNIDEIFYERTPQGNRLVLKKHMGD